MNERIKELAEQATSRTHRSQGFCGEPTHIYPGTLDPEKFAQSIVGECIKILADSSEFRACAIVVKHFGVEK
jgi:hypothetical protein